MAKLTLNDLNSLTNENSAITSINTNNDLIELAFENTLSRDGTSPNSMVANLDMNSYKIINLATPVSNTDAVNKSYVDGIALNGAPLTIGGTPISGGTNGNILYDNAGLVGEHTTSELKTALSLTSSDVGLGNVTNDVQTKASVVPNTAPAAGRILVGNTGGTAYAPVAMSGDATLASTGAITIANAVVSLAKMANLSANSILGNNTGSPATPIALTTAQVKTLLAYTSSDISLGNVTNDAQTKAAIVPNTVPTAGQLHVGNAGGTAFGVVSMSGDATISSAGAITVTKTNGISFATSATTDATNASNISAGTLSAARGGAGTVNGILRGNGVGVVSAAASGTDYAPATSGSSILYGNGSGGFSNVTIGTGLSFSTGTLSVTSALTNFTSDGITFSGSGQTVTTSKPILDLTQTWNAAGVAFTGLRSNITNTASSVASLLLDLQVGSTSLFSINRAGHISLINGVQTTFKGVFNGGAFIGNANNTDGWSFQTASAFVQPPAYYLGWTSTSGDSSGTADTRIYRDAANNLALRNSTNAQAFNIYSTYTDASNYSSVRISAGKDNSGFLEIFPKEAGTGVNTLQWFQFGPKVGDGFRLTASRMFFHTSNNIKFAYNWNTFGSSGGLEYYATFTPQATLSTTMTTGFFNIPGAAGAPTGTPDITTGVPLYYDKTNDKLYAYNGGWKASGVFA